MKDSLYLAWNYLKFYWVKTLIMVLSISLILFIPLALNILTSKGSERMKARAGETPLLIGSKGSATDLTLSALYLRNYKVPQIPYREFSNLESMTDALCIPLHLEYHVKQQPLIGTTAPYFNFRKLNLQQGRYMAVIGECVLGAEAARKLNAKVGDAVISSPTNTFDIAGSFPLEMKVTGILAPSNSPDDEAVFCDIKTAWIISGKAHGHEDVRNLASDSLKVTMQDGEAVASKAVLSYTRITPENIGSFHFHGEVGDYPLTAVIAVPPDKKSGLMLRDKLENSDGVTQIVVPSAIMDELLGTVMSVKDILTLAAISIGAATLLISILVFLLSIQLRKREIRTMHHLGASPASIKSILSLEIVLVLAWSVFMTSCYLIIINLMGLPLLEKFVT